MLDRINKFKGKGIWDPNHYTGDRNSFTHRQIAGYNFKQVPGVNKYAIFGSGKNYTCVFSHDSDTVVRCNAFDSGTGIEVMTVIFELGKPVAITNESDETRQLKYLILILFGRYASSFERYTIDSSRDSVNNKLLQLCKSEKPKIDEIEALIDANPHVAWNYLAPFTAAADVAMKTGNDECVKVLVKRFEILKGVIATKTEYNGKYFDKIKKEEEESDDM